MSRYGLIVGAIVVLVAVGAWVLQPRLVAVAKLHVRMTPSLFETAPYTEFSLQDAERTRKYLIQSLTSPIVLQPAVRDYLAAKTSTIDPEALVTRLQDDLRIRIIEDQFLEITLPASQDLDAAALVNAVIDASTREVMQRMHDHQKSQLGELQRVVDYGQMELKQKLHQLSNIRLESHAMEETKAMQSAFDQAMAARRVELAEREARLEHLRSKDSPDVATVVATLEAEVQELRAVVERLKSERRAAVSSMPRRDSIDELEHEIQVIQARTDRYVDQLEAFKLVLEITPPAVRVYEPARLHDRSALRAFARQTLGY